MFYDGDIQSGIATALAQRRLVGCFVHDDSPKSLEWEQSWLTDAELQPVLNGRVILLRLRDGSEEAGFLSAFCAIPSVPCLLMIHNGQLTAKLTADLSEGDFKARLRDAVMASVAAAASAPFPGGSAPMSPTSPAGDQRVRSVLDERRQRLEADKQRQDAADAAARKARADARRAEAETGTSGGRRTSQSTAANQARKVQQEARAERDRILAKIEHDKQARRDAAQHRRQVSQGDAPASLAGHASHDSTGSRSDHGGGPSGLKECHLQVRRFDGSTIRQRFSAWKTLRTHVRPWIDRERGGDDAPYEFRQVLVPLPNRLIAIAEEDEDLESLGLCPSATLIMVPIKGYTNAYAYDRNGGYVSKGVSTGYSIVSEIGGAIGSLFGYGTSSSAPSSSAPPRSDPDAAHPSIEGGGGEDQHLYTGNGINVEPRRDLRREDSWG